MNDYHYAALAIFTLAVLSLVIYLPALIAGARAEDFDRHVQADLDMIAADDRNTRLNANANGTGWY